MKHTMIKMTLLSAVLGTLCCASGPRSNPYEGMAWQSDAIVPHVMGCMGELTQRPAPVGKYAPSDLAMAIAGDNSSVLNDACPQYYNSRILQ